jgi:hypothetical protein
MNKLQTSKNKTYLDFYEVSKIKRKSHITEKGLEKMNSKAIIQK